MRVEVHRSRSPDWLRLAKAGLCSATASVRFAAGRYDRRSLAYYYCAWRESRSPDHLLQYVKWRRTLGLSVPGRLVRDLLGEFDALADDEQRQAVNLALEHHPDLLKDTSIDKISRLADRSPPIAALCRRGGVEPSDTGDLLARFHEQQDAWREAFRRFILANADSICVVGNAATLLGKGLGKRIDDHAVVWRFNRFARESRADASAPSADRNRMDQQRLLADTGTRITVWMRVLEMAQPAWPDGVAPDWTIVSGQDLRFISGNWEQVLPLLRAGRKVLTVPFPIWRGLVAELGAPPSAGLLALAWMLDILDRPSAVSIAGFQLQPGRSRYHSVIRFKPPGRRHNWPGERAILHRWIASGVRPLDP